VDTPDQQDVIDLYFKEAVTEPLLSQQEEVEIAQQIERGHEARMLIAEGTLDPEVRKELIQRIEDGEVARERLITANSRLVISIAKKYIGYGVPFGDLIQEGNIGLMRAVKKFDYRRGYKFSTYATWWIRQAVTRAIAMQGRTIRLPVHKEDEINHLKRELRQFSQEMGRQPTYDELAERLGTTPDRVEQNIKHAQRSISLEAPVGDEGTVLGDLIEDEKTPAPEDVAAYSILKNDLQEILSLLPEREQNILKLRYGLENGRSHTFREVGKIIGVTHERVRQIEATALRRLRKNGAHLKLRKAIE
jgi:RNA polymerase primary sigma factor